MTPGPLCEIQLVAPREAESALALVVRSWPADERAAQLNSFHTALAADPGRHVVLAACRAGRLVGAVYAQIAAGRSAGVYAPELEAGEDESTATDLLVELERQLAERDVHLAQSLLPLEARTAAQRLAAAGYRRLANLFYLVSNIEAFPDHPPSLPFQLEPTPSQISPRLQRLIETTYQDTLDCPSIDGLRDPADVLASYQDSSSGTAPRWFIANYRGNDVGCLLLNDHAQDDQLEIVYLALVPSVRGRGWGIELTRQAQWQARALSRSRVVLAVDANNDPAIEMYATCGFWVSDQRSAYIKGLRGTHVD